MNNDTVVMMGEGDRPAETHSGQPVSWSGWVSGSCSTLWTAVGHRPVYGLLIQLDVVGLGCSSLPVADHSAPLHPGTIPVNHVVWLIGMDCDAVVRVPMHRGRQVSPWASSWSPWCRFDDILYKGPCRQLLSSPPPERGAWLASGSAWGSSLAW